MKLSYLLESENPNLLVRRVVLALQAELPDELPGIIDDVKFDEIIEKNISIEGGVSLKCSGPLCEFNLDVTYRKVLFRCNPPVLDNTSYIDISVRIATKDKPGGGTTLLTKMDDTDSLKYLSPDHVVKELIYKMLRKDPSDENAARYDRIFFNKIGKMLPSGYELFFRKAPTAQIGSRPLCSMYIVSRMIAQMLPLTFNCKSSDAAGDYTFAIGNINIYTKEDLLHELNRHDTNNDISPN